MSKKSIRNIGIFAHVDAGKTTVSENMLFLSGAIKVKGNVDKGTCRTDFLDIEKARGISVRASATKLTWKNVDINIIDTPGHIDFSSEVERTLSVIDGAVLIISAVEGVQAQTENIWVALQKLSIPTIIFINKLDRAGADYESVIEEISKELTNKTVLLQTPKNEANDNLIVSNLWTSEMTDFHQNIKEFIVENDDKLMELYFNESDISIDQYNQSLVNSVKESIVYPILLGSAKNEIGIDNLLDSIITFLPEPKGSANENLHAKVYKIEHSKELGKLVSVRVFSGSISAREVIKNLTQNIEEKVTLIYTANSEFFEMIDKVEAGGIAKLTGLQKVEVGDIFGSDITDIKADIVLRKPLLTIQVSAVKESEYSKLADALSILCVEDPNLDFEWDKDEKKLHIKIMGEVQQEIIQSVLAERFGVEAEFGKPSVIYMETPIKTAEGYVRYWMPKPCWAIIKFLIEPAERGSGVKYKSEVSVDKIQLRYQKEVEKTIATALKQGIKGWEVTDINITMIDGEDHESHTKSSDFVIATPMGIMDGLVNSGTNFLEPILSFKIIAPEDFLGSIASDLHKMRATFANPLFENEKVTLTGTIPVATSFDYPITLGSKTKGKGKFFSKFHSYQICKNEDAVEQDYKGISPLDTAKYILKARGALS